jgi:hypothetical protein
MFQALSRPLAIVAVSLTSFVLLACGESSEEKAAKQVCSAVTEINTQLKRLETLPITLNFPTEAKSSVEAIDKSINKIKEAEPKLEAARREEIDAADKAFETELAKITADVVSATKSSNLETALKAAQPEVKASLTKVTNAYKKAFEALKCS